MENSWKIKLWSKAGLSGVTIIGSSLRKLGTLCFEFLIWSFVFLVRLIAGWLKGSTLEVIARKETSYGDVLLGPFSGAFGKKGIVEFLKIAIILLILFGLCCNSQLLGGVQITPNTFLIISFQWYTTIGRPSFFSSFWGGSSCPLPLGCSFLLYEYTCFI